MKNQPLNYLRNLLALFVLMFAASPGKAQVDFVPTGGIEGAFNLNDVFLGASAGVEAVQWKANVTGGFGLRPGSKKVLVQSTETEYYQYHERRYMFWMSVEKRISVLKFDESNALQGWADLRGGFTFGDYRGTTFQAPSRFVFIPAAGLAVHLDPAVIKVGYQYMPLGEASIPDHRIFIGVSLIGE